MKSVNLKYYKGDNNPLEVHLVFLWWLLVPRLLDTVPQMCQLHCWLSSPRLSLCDLGTKALPSATFLTWLDGFGEAHANSWGEERGQIPIQLWRDAATSELWVEKKICTQLYKFLLDPVPNGVYLSVYIYLHKCVQIDTHMKFSKNCMLSQSCITIILKGTGGKLLSSSKALAILQGKNHS